MMVWQHTKLTRYSGYVDWFRLLSFMLFNNKFFPLIARFRNPSNDRYYHCITITLYLAHYPFSSRWALEFWEQSFQYTLLYTGFNIAVESKRITFVIYLCNCIVQLGKKKLGKKFPDNNLRYWQIKIYCSHLFLC